MEWKENIYLWALQKIITISSQLTGDPQKQLNQIYELAEEAIGRKRPLKK